MVESLWQNANDAILVCVCTFWKIRHAASKRGWRFSFSSACHLKRRQSLEEHPSLPFVCAWFDLINLQLDVSMSNHDRWEWWDCSEHAASSSSLVSFASHLALFLFRSRRILFACQKRLIRSRFGLELSHSCGEFFVCCFGRRLLCRGFAHRKAGTLSSLHFLFLFFYVEEDCTLLLGSIQSSVCQNRSQPLNLCGYKYPFMPCRHIYTNI